MAGQGDGAHAVIQTLLPAWIVVIRKQGFWLWVSDRPLVMIARSRDRESVQVGLVHL
jgi:hypothetical protein